MSVGPVLYDLFLSHATPDKDWVRSLNAALIAAGVKPYFDVNELQPADNFVLALGDGLRQSRYLVVVLTRESVERVWVVKEWTTFMSIHGPYGRVIPVFLDAIEIPDMLRTCQGIWANDRDAARVARLLAERVGKGSDLPPTDARSIGFFGQSVAYTLTPDGDQVRVVAPDGSSRTVAAPTAEPGFGQSLLAFRRLAREAATTDSDRASLISAATDIGKRLFSTLFDDAGRDTLARATLPGAPRALLTVSSAQDAILSLPWELLHDGAKFLVRDGVIDIARTTPDQTAAAPSKWDGPFSLVVNVSAPTGQHQLDYEAESYRITRAVGEGFRTTPTELGTVEDLIDNCKRITPRGVHFSGHGGPGLLVFEDDIGHQKPVSIHDLAIALKRELPGGRLPPFFYLASCSGNDLAESIAESSVARLHREGVDYVVGYHLPIVDELSTRAEEALYASIANGLTTREAVREARNAILKPFGEAEARLRHDATAPGVSGLFPMAWAQLVYYHRGSDVPLHTPTKPGAGAVSTAPPERDYWGGDKRMLKTGFIGRRREMHRIRKRIRAGGPESRVFVFQGFGGLGKTTLQFQMPTLLRIDRDDVCVLWCAATEKEPMPVEALAKQLSDHAEKRFAADNWIGVIQAVDRQAGADPVARFAMFLSVLLQNVEKLLLVVDNLESLLTGPDDVISDHPDPKAFGNWKDEDIARWWGFIRDQAGQPGKFFLVASTRYQHADYADVQLEVSDLPPDAVFRLTRWFPDLGKLSPTTRAKLGVKLAGHPRAVEYANDLIRHQFTQLRKRGAIPPQTDAAWEWQKVVAPVLPAVAEKLEANLLLKAIWEKVLDDRMRRMLYRMTLLRRPWEWDLHAVLGDPDEPAESAEQTAEELSRTSLLIREEYPNAKPDFSIHPALAAFVRRRFGDGEAISFETHRRVGTHLEAGGKPEYFENCLEAGHHLFQAGEYDRAYDLLGSASDWLQQRGRVVEGLDILTPFLASGPFGAMSRDRIGRLLGTIGLAYADLGRVQEGIDYYQQQLVITREFGDRLGEGTALGNLGLAYASLGRLEMAINHYQKQLEIVHEIGDRRGEGNALGNLGVAYEIMGRVVEAIDHYQQVLVIMLEMENRQGVGTTLGNLGNAYYFLGRVEEAIDHQQQALVVSREIGDRRGEGNALGNLGLVYTDIGRVQEAIGCHQQALDISREIGDRAAVGRILGNLGLVDAVLGRVEDAINHHKQRLIIAREIGDRRGEGGALGNLGLVYAGLRRVEEAIDHYQQQQLIAREVGDRRGEGSALGNLGIVYADIGRVEEAIPLLEQALRIGQEIQDPRIVGFVSGKLAKLRGKPPPDASTG